MPISFTTAAAGIVLAVGVATAPTSCGMPDANSPTRPAAPAVVDWPITPKPAPQHRDANGTGNAGSGYACEPGWVCGTCPPDSKYGVHEWGYDPVEVDRLHIPHDHPCG